MSTTERTYIADLNTHGYNESLKQIMAATERGDFTINAGELVAAAVAARVLADARVHLRERLWGIAAGELAEWAEARGIEIIEAEEPMRLQHIEPMLIALTDDALPGRDVRIARNDSEWHVAQEYCGMDESVPTGIVGNGPTLADALRTALEHAR